MYAHGKIKDKAENYAEDDAGKVIDGKASGAPSIFESFANHIIEVQGKCKPEQVVDLRYNSKGDKSPYLSPEDKCRVKREHLDKCGC